MLNRGLRYEGISGHSYEGNSYVENYQFRDEFKRHIPLFQEKGFLTFSAVSGPRFEP